MNSDRRLVYIILLNYFVNLSFRLLIIRNMHICTSMIAINPTVPGIFVGFDIVLPFQFAQFMQVGELNVQMFATVLS